MPFIRILKDRFCVTNGGKLNQTLSCRAWGVSLLLQRVVNFYFQNSAGLKTRKCGPESWNSLSSSTGALSGRLRVVTSLNWWAVVLKVKTQRRFRKHKDKKSFTLHHILVQWTKNMSEWKKKKVLQWEVSSNWELISRSNCEIFMYFHPYYLSTQSEQMWCTICGLVQLKNCWIRANISARCL